MRSLLLVLVCVVVANGQGQIAGTTTPDPAVGGGTVTLTLSAVSGTIHLPSSQGFTSVRSGSPTGPIVPCGCFSLPVIVTVNACQSYSTTWVAPTVILPETFWFEVVYYDAAWSQFTEFFPVTVNTAGPVLNEFSGALLGSWWQLALSAPGSAGMPYAAVASFTTNSGIAVPGIGFIALDNDVLFQLTLANALPGYSLNLQGVLDMQGASPPIALFIPQLPQLACMALHMQAAVLQPSGSIALSQCHDTRIL